jgi:hypothetical protein
MTPEQLRLLALVDDAFTGVELADGVSLHQACVIDSYGSTAEEIAARHNDETTDWHALVNDSELHRMCSLMGGYWNFCDAVGARFHLPACLAFMVADPTDQWVPEILEALVYSLTDGAFRRSHLLALTDAQLTCFKEVMVALRSAWAYSTAEYQQAVNALHRE